MVIDTALSLNLNRIQLRLCFLGRSGYIWPNQVVEMGTSNQHHHDVVSIEPTGSTSSACVIANGANEEGDGIGRNSNSRSSRRGRMPQWRAKRRTRGIGPCYGVLLLVATLTFVPSSMAAGLFEVRFSAGEQGGWGGA